MSGTFKKILRNTVLPLAFSAHFVGGSMSAASAQEVVGLRAWAHTDFGRLVFDWPSNVNVTTAIQGQTLVLSFSKPFDASLAPVAEHLSGYLGQGSFSSDKLRLSFPLRQSLAVSHFKNGQSIVVDLKPATPTSSQVAENSGNTTSIRVRVGEHDNFTRLVFDWPNNVTYNADLTAGQLVLSFAAEAGLNLAQLREQLPDGFSDLTSSSSNGGTRFALTAPADTGLRHFKSGNKVVVDLVKGAGQPARSAPETAPAQVQAETEEPNNQSPEVSVPDPVESETVELPPVTPAPTTSVTQAEVNEVGEVQGELDTAQIQKEDEALAKAEAEGSVTLLRPDQAELAARLAEKKRQEAQKQSGPAPVTLLFPWSENVGAAVFRRGENVWIVFDKRAPVDLAPLRQQGQPLITRVEQLPVGGATVFRLKTLPGINPIVQKEGFDWLLEFRQGPILPSIQATIQADVDGDIGPHLNFPSDEPGVLINLPDPDIGDVLRIATIKEPGIGVQGQRAYPEFTLLASAQGVVVEMLGDEVFFDRELDGFRLYSTEGLHISAISPEAPVADISQLSSKRLFDFEEWLRGGPDKYQKDRQELITTVQDTDPVDKNDARFKLAEFYLAHGRGPEAKGVLEVIALNDQTIETRPDYRAMLGAAHFLNWDYDSARQTLNDPRLDGFSEASIWRGATLAELGEWKQAVDYFKAGDSLLLRYPYPLKATLAMLRIEAALATRDLRSAENWLDELDKGRDKLSRGQLAALRYHQARIALTKNNLDQAHDIWKDLAAGPDQFNAVRSQYALVNHGLKQETLSLDEAIDILDKLRYRWRGDSFELAVLRRLSELHFENLDYRNGLNIMKTVVTYYPETPIGKEMAEEMVNIFKRLYLEGDADLLPPLKALAIYDEFRELTPSGPDGDEMIEKLADRLIAVDLLNRAAALLDHQVRFRLQGENRARVGAKLALVHLIDGQAEDAIRALNASQSPQLNEDLEGDRRRLRAKAAFELGDLPEAIKLLAGDVSKEADMLRRDMFWAEENWSEVSRVLQSLAGNPPDEAELGLDDEKAGYVLNWAVALRLNEDEDGLALLNELYGPAMQFSALANAYNFIATSVNSERPEKLQDMIRQLANSDMFNAFVNNYRDKLLSQDDDEYRPEDEAPLSEVETPA
ncbi:AMIN domain-containing protein [Curvivirga aplysinae]|uniref:AMIN domain-containing protein n=1 Tax=Curvivirga aplysinae TaxID=2529852 RepID=UPI0012BD5F76|nr:AMIN domain-containing protein [Curvivirga aplysinae]MTI11240.1 hypothetical protein [Curvivirga aplysinae]